VEEEAPFGSYEESASVQSPATLAGDFYFKSKKVKLYKKREKMYCKNK